MSVSYSQPCLISRTRESNATTRTACSSTPERSTRIYAVTHEFVPVFYRELEQVREREFLVGSSSKCALVVVGHFLCVCCEIPIRPAAHAKPQTVVAHEPLTCDGRRLRYQHPSSSSTPCTAPLQTRRLQTSGSHARRVAIHSALLHRIFGDDSAHTDEHIQGARAASSLLQFSSQTRVEGCQVAVSYGSCAQAHHPRALSPASHPVSRESEVGWD